MNEYELLLTGDKFMLEMHLKITWIYIWSIH